MRKNRGGKGRERETSSGHWRVAEASGDLQSPVRELREREGGEREMEGGEGGGVAAVVTGWWKCSSQTVVAGFIMKKTMNKGNPPLFRTCSSAWRVPGGVPGLSLSISLPPHLSLSKLS